MDRLLLNIIYILFFSGVVGISIFVYIVLNKRLEKVFRRRFADLRHGREQKSIHSSFLIRKLNLFLEIANVKLSLWHLLFLTVVIWFITFFGLNYIVIYLYNTYSFMNANILNSSYILYVTVATLASSAPLNFVYFRFLNKRRDMSFAMIPHVQNFLGVYNSIDNLPELIRKSIDGAPAELKRHWENVSFEINSGIPTEKAVLNFAEKVGSVWADDFVDALIIRLKFVNDITDMINKILSNMFESFENEKKRQTTLFIYRWGTVIMIIIGFIVVWINIKLDSNNFYYYFQTPSGIKSMTISFFILFIALIVVMLTGRKRI